jgi:hypothetical protein
MPLKIGGFARRQWRLPASTGQCSISTGKTARSSAGWGAIVVKYADGTPVIVEGTFGSGWVILSGVHAEAPERWRHGMTFRTPVSVDNA